MLTDNREGSRLRRPIAMATASVMGLGALWAAGIAPAQAQETGQIAPEFSGPSDGIPEGWSSLWNEGSWSTVGDDFTVLRHDIPVDVDHEVPRGVTWDGIGDDGVATGDVEAHTLMQVPGDLGPNWDTTRFGLGVHLGGDAGSETGYFVDIAGTELRIGQYTDGSVSYLGDAYDLGGFEGAVWHNLVLSQRGDTLSAKAWPQGKTEPAEWQVTVDGIAEETREGRVGVFNVDTAGNRDAATETAFLSVGLDEADAPRAPEDLIPDPEHDPLLTGFENREGEGWTSHAEELAFLEAVDAASDRTTLRQIGESANGLPINLMQIGGPEGVPSDEEIAEGRSILLIGSQHGNEPAGQEMTLQLLRDLALSPTPEQLEQLSHTTIMVIPTINPDGRLANDRLLANGVDMNRDHLALNEIETQVLAQITRDFKPDVVLDAHEKPRTLEGADLDGLWPRNLAVDADLLALANEMVEDHMFSELEAQGITPAIYGGPRPEDGAGDENEGIGRNMLGLSHSVGVLIETPGLREGTERVEAQYAAALAMLSFQRENAERIEEVTAAAPENRAADGLNQEPFHLFGADNDPPKPETTLDPGPCGYVLTPEQAARVALTFELRGVESVTLDSGDVFVSMAQPMMTVVPFMLDPGARSSLVDGVAVFEGSDCVQPAIVNVTVPTITGTPEVGQTLTADPGAWDPADVSLSYQWLADGEAVEGAEDAQLALTEAHLDQEISIVVTAAAEGFESASAESEPVGPVAAASTPGEPGDGDEGGSDEGGSLPETGSSTPSLALLATAIVLTIGTALIVRRRTA